MRIAYSTVMTLLLVSAIPAIGLAQVLSPFRDTDQREHRLDRLVSVATVNLVGDVVALADSRVVDDPTGEPFVLGAATLDLRDPSHAQIVFSMTNASTEPIPWNTVELSVRRVTPVPLDDQIKGAPALFFCAHGALAGHPSRPTSPKGAWQPGATVTVQVPVADDCFRRSEAADPLAFLVYAGSELPHPDLLLGPSDPGWSAVAARNKALFRRAFEKLTEHPGGGNE